MKRPCLVLVLCIATFLGYACDLTDPEGGPLAVAVVAVAPSTVPVVVGDTTRFVAAAFDGSGVELPGISFTWGSSDSTVVIADSAGLATALAPGEAVVFARAGAAIGHAFISVAPTEARAIGMYQLRLWGGQPVPAVQTPRWVVASGYLDLRANGTWLETRTDSILVPDEPPYWESSDIWWQGTWVRDTASPGLVLLLTVQGGAGRVLRATVGAQWLTVTDGVLPERTYERSD